MSKKIRISCLLLLLCVQSLAQATFGSVEEVWKYADDHNVTVKNAQLEVLKAEAAKKQAYMAFTPSATLQGTFTKNTSLQTTLLPAEVTGGPAGTYRAVQFGQKYIYSGGFSVNLDVVNLQTWFNVRVAALGVALNEAAVGNAKKGAYQQIAQQYFSYQLMAEAAHTASITTSISDSLLQSIKHKFQEGTVGQGTVDIAELNLTRAEKTLVSAQYQLVISKNNLKALLDMGPKDSLLVNGSLTRDVAIAPEAPFAIDPAVKLAKVQELLSISQYRAARANYLPTVTLQYSNSEQQNDNTFRPFQGGAPWFPASFYTLNANWALTRGGNRWLQVQRSHLSAQQAALQQDNAEKTSTINDENARLNYAKARATYEKAKRIMDLSLDSYRHITNKYEAGLVAIDDRLNALADYMNYQDQYLNSLSDLLLQVYNLKIRQQTF